MKFYSKNNKENPRRIVGDREDKIKNLENQLVKIKNENQNLIQENLRLKVELKLKNSILNLLVVNHLSKS